MTSHQGQIYTLASNAAGPLDGAPLLRMDPGGYAFTVEAASWPADSSVKLRYRNLSDTAWVDVATLTANGTVGILVASTSRPVQIFVTGAVTGLYASLAELSEVNPNWPLVPGGANPALPSIASTTASFSAAVSAGTLLLALPALTTGETRRLFPNDPAIALGSGGVVRGLGAVAPGQKLKPRLRRRRGADFEDTDLELAVEVPVTRFASTQNQMHGQAQQLSALGASFTGIAQRWPHVFPYENTEIAFTWNNWFSPNTGIGDFTDTGNALTILEAYAQFPNGTVLPLRFGGSASRRMASGENDVRCDPIVAAAAGYGDKFPANMTVWVKSRFAVDAPTDRIPISKRIVQEVAGQSLYFDPAATTIGNMAGSGNLTATGTAPSSQVYGIQPWGLGKAVDQSKPVLGVNGDSITENQGDTVEAAPHGRGWFQRLIADLLIPSINFAVAGAGARMGTTDARQLYWYDFMTHGMIYLTGNDFGTAQGTGGNAVTQQVARDRVKLVRDRQKSRGVRKVGLVKNGICASAPSNSYTDESVQTSIWVAGSQLALFNDNVAADGYDFIVPNNANRGTDPWKVLTTGANLPRHADAAHPAKGGHISLKDEAKPFVVAALGLA